MFFYCDTYLYVVVLGMDGKGTSVEMFCNIRF